MLKKKKEMKMMMMRKNLHIVDELIFHHSFDYRKQSSTI